MSLIKRNVKKEDDDLESKRIQEIKALEEQILKCKDEYYNGNPSLTDSEYDGLENRLGELDSENKVLTLVGAPVKNDFPKIEHTQVMLSLDKVYTAEELNKWAGDKETTASFKIDGNSLKLYYENGELVRAATRGTGKVGVDVTPNARTIRDVPLKLKTDYTGEIIGEVYMKKSVFGKHVARIKKDIEFLKAKQEDLPSSPRNYASGSLKQEDPRITYERELNFMAYDVTVEKFTLKSKCEVFQTLKDFGFSIPKVACKVDSIVVAIEAFEKAKQEVDYAVDGIVFEFDDLEHQEKLFHPLP